jgi:hypothetical protein
MQLSSRLEMTQIKDSINFNLDSGIDEQCTSRMSVCQPLSRDGMNLTPIFFFDTGSHRFHSIKHPYWQHPAELIVVRQVRIACLYAIRQVIYRSHQTSNDVTQLLKQESA